MRSVITSILLLISSNVFAYLNPVFHTKATSAYYDSATSPNCAGGQFGTYCPVWITSSTGAYFQTIPSELADDGNCYVEITVNLQNNESDSNRIRPSSQSSVSGFTYKNEPYSTTFYRNDSSSCRSVASRLGVEYGRMNNVVMDRRAKYADPAAVYAFNAYNKFCVYIRMSNKLNGVTQSIKSYNTCTSSSNDPVPAPVTCNLSLPQLLDHGIIDTMSVMGNVASVSGQISCTGKSNAALSLLSSVNTIDLGDGITSKITLCINSTCSGDDSSVSGVINTSSPISVTSTLVSDGSITPGDKSGQLVLYASYY